MLIGMTGFSSYRSQMLRWYSVWVAMVAMEMKMKKRR